MQASSPDGSLRAKLTADGMLTMADGKTGEDLFSTPLGGEASSVAEMHFSTLTYEIILIGESGSRHSFNLDTRKLTQAHEGEIRNRYSSQCGSSSDYLLFDPKTDGKILAFLKTCLDVLVIIWNPITAILAAALASIFPDAAMKMSRIVKGLVCDHHWNTMPKLNRFGLLGSGGILICVLPTFARLFGAIVAVELLQANTEGKFE
mmetsp:Transcript_29355/g.47666  ORF Transcript_29355/g.47666 Transcript_29355/m.47666 type:complete len:205 (-) Transcript_29355:257-871(-)|eukprot:jgi/Bigna1/126602/aug1.3_g1310